jgi:hypothetical protein
MKVFFGIVVLVSLSTSAVSAGSNFSKLIRNNKFLLPAVPLVIQVHDNDRQIRNAPVGLQQKNILPFFVQKKFISLSFCDPESNEDQDKKAEFDEIKKLWFTPFSFLSNRPQHNWKKASERLIEIAITPVTHIITMHHFYFLKVSIPILKLMEFLDCRKLLNVRSILKNIML